MKQFLLILLLLICSSLNAQEKTYCVVTFSEKGRSWDPPEVDYYMIIPLERISKQLRLGVPIYPFIVGDSGMMFLYRTRGELNHYWLDTRHFKVSRKTEDSHSLVIVNNRKLIQSFNLSYAGIKHKIKVKVYITPIKGEIESIVSTWDNHTVMFSDNFSYWEEFYQDKELYDSIRYLYFIGFPYFNPGQGGSSILHGTAVFSY